MIKVLMALIVALPEIVRLLNTMIKKLEEAETDRRVKDDLSAIEKAFREKDEEALRRIMSGS